MDELLLRSIKGKTSADEEALVTHWRGESAQNEAAYQELERLVLAARRLETGVTTGDPPPIADLIRRAEPVAAGLPGTSPAPPIRRPLRKLLVAGAIAAAAVLGFASGQGRQTRPVFSFGGTEFITGRSELATVRLADGSVVHLAPQSRLKVSGTDEREAWLDGRGYFAVAKMEGRPFRVMTRAGNAQVLGTRFDLAVGDSGLRLVVVEGQVALSAEGKRVEVNAGEMSQVVRGSSVSITKVPDVLPLLDWRNGFLAFQATPLRDAAREIERQYDVQVLIADSLLARQTISVWFVDRSVTEVMRIVCMVVNARCSTDGKTVRVAR
jgi:transmembrane sensor